MSPTCRQHVADMSATTVMAVTATQNQLTVPTLYVCRHVADMSTHDIAGVNLPLPANMTWPTFAAKLTTCVVVS